jgi:hypothetical protein
LNGRLCIVEACDIWVFNYPASDRWVVIANRRNKFGTDMWSADAERSAHDWGKATGKTKDMCGGYAPTGGGITSTDDKTLCAMARRYVAVSKTSGPRDGFHLYAISADN